MLAIANISRDIFIFRNSIIRTFGLCIKSVNQQKSALDRYFHRQVQLYPRTTMKGYRNLTKHLLKKEKSDGQSTGRFIPNSVPDSMTKRFTLITPGPDIYLVALQWWENVHYFFASEPQLLISEKRHSRAHESGVSSY